MNLDEIFKDIFGEEYEEPINEGLIRTVAPEKVVELVEYERMPYSGYPIQYKNNSIGIRYSMHKGFPPIEVTKEKVDKLNRMMNNLGYFPSLYRSLSITYLSLKKYDQEKVDKSLSNSTKDLIEIVYFPKFLTPIKNDELPIFIYHICDGSVVEKIKKIGLSPKTKNKIEIHPDRVYFCKTTDCMKELMKHSAFIKNTTSDKICLLKIDTRKVDRDVDFYLDPSHKDAIFTYQNINRSSIEVTQILDKAKPR